MSHGVADLTVRFNAPLDMFKRVLVDGIELTSSSYELTEGSTTVTLKAGYLSTLATGTHTLAIESETGTASTTFTIVEKQAEAGGTPSSPSSGKPVEAPQMTRPPTSPPSHRRATTPRRWPASPASPRQASSSSSHRPRSAAISWQRDTPPCNSRPRR